MIVSSKHGSLAVRRIVGVGRSNRKTGRVGNAWIDRRARSGAMWLDQMFTASVVSIPATVFAPRRSE